MVHGLLGEVGHAARLEGLVQGAGIVRVQDQAAQGALGDQLSKLLRRGIVVDRRSRLLKGDLETWFIRDAHGQPAIVDPA